MLNVVKGIRPVTLADKIVEYSVPMAFMILPFGIISHGLIWKSQAIFLVLMLLPLIALSIKNKWIKWFFVYAALWQLFIFYTTFINVRNNPAPGLSVILSFIAGAYIFKRVSESKLPLDNWYSFIRIAVIIQLAISISQYLGFNPVTYILGKVMTVKEYTPGHFVGLIGNRNYLMAFFAISIPMLIGWKFKWHIEKPFGMDHVYPWDIKIPLGTIALFIIFAAMAVSPSPGVLAAIIGIAIYFGGKKRIAIGFVLAVLFACIFIFFTGSHLDELQRLPGQIREVWNTGTLTFDYNGVKVRPEDLPPTYDLGRFGMWIVAISKLFKPWIAIIIGHGPGAGWGMVYTLHSEYVTTLFYFGLIGFLLLIGYVFTTLKFLVKSGNKVLLTSFVILCIDAAGNSSLHIPTTALLIVIVCGLIERERIQNV